MILEKFKDIFTDVVAQDIMNKNFIKLHEDMDIDLASEEIRKSKESALPVVQDGYVIGILSEKDCIEFLHDLEKYENSKSKVKSYMKKPVMININDRLEDIIIFFLKTKFKMFPVIEDAKIVGVLHRRDILPFIEKIRKMV